MSLNAPAAYDVRNRLAGYSDVADRFDMSLSYNGRGERVARAVNRTGMAGELDGFYYSESGQLLGRQRGDEKSGGTVINEEIVWLDQTPVARVWVEDGSIAQVHAIHSDHLNTPRALANAQAQANQASGTIVWRWKLNQQTPTGSNAFGAQLATEDPDNNGTLIKFDLRFPGQQYDAATGLHYNYFRDYEAGTGRYVESDPIGLRGGAALYSYVLSTPYDFSDQDGLRRRCRWVDATTSEAGRQFTYRKCVIEFIPDPPAPSSFGTPDAKSCQPGASGCTWWSCLKKCGSYYSIVESSIAAGAATGVGLVATGTVAAFATGAGEAIAYYEFANLSACSIECMVNSCAYSFPASFGAGQNFSR